MAIAAVVGGQLVGCEPEVDITPPKPAAAEVPTAQTQADWASLPLSERLLGRWTVRLADVPDAALTPDFKKLRESGRDQKITLEYEFLRGEFVLRKSGPGGPVARRFNYQIAQELGETLVLERDAGEGEGEPKRIHASISGRRLRIGSGPTALDLQRN